MIKTATFVMSAFLSMQCGHAGVIAFSYTGSNQTYVVPNNVIALHVSIWGGGGGGSGLTGAAGAYVTGDLAVNGGDSLLMIVGGGGLGSTTGTNSGGFGGGGLGGAGGLGGNGLPGQGGPGGNGGGGGGLSGIFANSFSAANALVVAGGGGGGGGNFGSLPTLLAGNGSTLVGGKGGNGGLGGSTFTFNPFNPGPTQIFFNGFNAGGGAGGGFNGGTAGNNGGFQQLGSNGGSAGSLLSHLTNSSLSASPTGRNSVGTLDPNFLSSAAGFGGNNFASAQDGRIVITEIFAPVAAVPEPSSIGVFSIFGAAMLFRRRWAKPAKCTM